MEKRGTDHDDGSAELKARGGNHTLQQAPMERFKHKHNEDVE
jgi:hypothetical protein